MSLEDKIEQLSFADELAENAELKPYYWVNQSNALVNTRQNLSINERRLLYVLVSLVQPEDKDFKTYILQTKQLASLFGISESGFYERIRETVNGLNSKPLTIQRTKENQKIVTDDIYWVQRATYEDGQITIKLSEDLSQFLIDLKSYTKYQLYNVLKLKSEFSWRLYELLKERERFGKRIFDVQELREKLAIDDGKYKTMSNFRAIVLDRAKKEIGEKTDIKFEYEAQKVGRSIKSFVFYIYKNNKNIKTNHLDEAVNYDIQSILNLLISKGILRERAVELVEKYPLKYIEENIRYVIRMEDKGLENLAGYIISAIENNYAESTYELEFEDSLLQLAIGNASNRLKERTDRDIHDLEELYDYFINVLNKNRIQTKEELDQIKVEMSRSLFKKMNDIYDYRKSHRLPPLLEDDFKESKVKSYFSKWLAQHESELPY